MCSHQRRSQPEPQFPVPASDPRFQAYRGQEPPQYHHVDAQSPIYAPPPPAATPGPAPVQRRPQPPPQELRRLPSPHPPTTSPSPIINHIHIHTTSANVPNHLAPTSPPDTAVARLSSFLALKRQGAWLGHDARLLQKDLTQRLQEKREEEEQARNFAAADDSWLSQMKGQRSSGAGLRWLSAGEGEMLEERRRKVWAQQQREREQLRADGGWANGERRTASAPVVAPWDARTGEWYRKAG